MGSHKIRLKKGDTVVVITGKDKGRQGTVLRVMQARTKKWQLKQGPRLMVEGINMMKKHVKANPQAEVAGGIIEKEAPITISNVAIFNPITGKRDGIRYLELEDGKKIRVFKKTGEKIDL